MGFFVLLFTVAVSWSLVLVVFGYLFSRSSSLQSNKHIVEQYIPILYQAPDYIPGTIRAVISALGSLLQPQLNLLHSNLHDVRNHLKYNVIHTKYNSWVPSGILKIPSFTRACIVWKQVSNPNFNSDGLNTYSNQNYFILPHLSTYMGITYGICVFIKDYPFLWLHKQSSKHLAYFIQIFYVIGFFVIGLLSIYCFYYMLCCALRFIWVLISNSSNLVAINQDSINAHPFFDTTIQPANILLRSNISGFFLQYLQRIMKKYFTYSTFPLEPLYTTRLWAAASSGSTQNQGIISSALIPGITSPLSFLPYILISFTIGGLIHEIGHAIAASTSGIKIKRFGFIFFIAFPAAYVELDQKKLLSVTYFQRFKILFAGIWHNFVLAILLLCGLFSLSIVISPLYSNGDSKIDSGVVVLDVNCNSTFYNLIKRRDLVVGINDYKIKSTVDSWENSLKEAMNDNDVGYCISKDKYSFNSKSDIKYTDYQESLECCKFYDNLKNDNYEINDYKNLVNTWKKWETFFDYTRFLNTIRDNKLLDSSFTNKQCFVSKSYGNMKIPQFSDDGSKNNNNHVLENLDMYACVPYLDIGKLSFCNAKATNECKELGSNYECMSAPLPTEVNNIKPMKLVTLSVIVEKSSIRQRINNEFSKILSYKEGNYFKDDENFLLNTNIESGDSVSDQQTVIRVGFIGDPSDIWANIRIGTLVPRFYFKYFNMLPLRLPYLLERFLVILLNVNLSLAFFNFLPLPTLDGREMVRCALEFIITVFLIKRRRLYNKFNKQLHDQVNYKNKIKQDISIVSSGIPQISVTEQSHRRRGDSANTTTINLLNEDQLSTNAPVKSPYSYRSHYTFNKDENGLIDFLKEWIKAIKLANEMPILSLDNNNSTTEAKQWKFDSIQVIQNAEHLEKIACFFLTAIVGISALLSLLYM